MGRSSIVRYSLQLKMKNWKIKWTACTPFLPVVNSYEAICTLQNRKHTNSMWFEPPCLMSRSSDHWPDFSTSIFQDIMGIENVKHVILILSGKGGVGKSTVSCELAVALQELGHKVICLCSCTLILWLCFWSLWSLLKANFVHLFSFSLFAYST